MAWNNVSEKMQRKKQEEFQKPIIEARESVFKELTFINSENILEEALKKEFIDMGFAVEQQKSIDVYYKKLKVGSLFADLIIWKEIENINYGYVLEIKVVDVILTAHKYQLFSYMKLLADKEVDKQKILGGAVVNFGKHSRKKECVELNSGDRFSKPTIGYFETILFLPDFGEIVKTCQR